MVTIQHFSGALCQMVRHCPLVANQDSPAFFKRPLTIFWDDLEFPRDFSHIVGILGIVWKFLTTPAIREDSGFDEAFIIIFNAIKEIQIKVDWQKLLRIILRLIGAVL